MTSVGITVGAVLTAAAFSMWGWVGLAVGIVACVGIGWLTSLA